MNKSIATRVMREHPDLEQLKRQSKELLEAFRTGEATTVAEVSAHFQSVVPSTFALHDAQFVLARAYGFESWPKLKAYVEGVSVDTFKAVIRAGDVDRVREMLKLRPELANAKLSGYDDRALHHAVAERRADVVRVLMESGADANAGMHIEAPSGNYPSAWDLAKDRGYSEIEALLREKAASHAHVGLEPQVPRRSGPTAHDSQPAARLAVATGDAEWLRTRHAQGTLGNPRYGNEGLVSLAVRHDRLDILTLLLDFGFDPDERQRLDLEPAQDSWGQPLLNCVHAGQIEMAQILLARGADPNGHIYAAGTPTSAAYSRQDAAWIELMERHGGYLDADMVGSMGYVDRARQMLEDEAAGRLRPEAIPYMSEPESIAELLIGDGLGTMEILELALPRITRSPDDPWWAWRLHRAWGDGDLTRLRMILERCHIAVCAPTELHQIAGNWPRSKKYDAADRLAKATAMLDAGARLDVRDEWFKSTPLGWACRYGRMELVKLYLERGADSTEPDAEPWTTPLAWAEKMKHPELLALLRCEPKLHQK